MFTNLFEDLLLSAALGGMYYAGRANGKNDAIKLIADHEKDQELIRLRREVDALKRK